MPPLSSPTYIQQYVSPMSIKYLSLPIYSIAINGDYIYFSGGGGGSTGIPNEIKIYHRTITPEPAASIPAGRHILENLTVCEQKQIVVANANAHVVVFTSVEGGKQLEELYRFEADFAAKDATINSICFSKEGDLVCVGGDDTTVRFFRLGEGEAQLVHSYSNHSHPIKNVDHNQADLYLSTDNHRITVCNLPKKQIVRTVYQDQLLPEKSLFQSAYFSKRAGEELLITHFIFKQATYVTKEAKGKFSTVQVAQDQSCLTAFHRDRQMLGIACGNGTTMLFNSEKMSSMGREQHHKFVITGCTITPKTHRFLTGTPECSYHIQNAEDTFNFSCRWLINLVVAIGVIFLFAHLDEFSAKEGEL